MILESSQNMLRHNRLRHPVNTENQQQIKPDDMHAACDPNHNGKQVKVSSTSNTHWQRTQVHIWVRLAWTSQHHRLYVGRGSFPHAARAHAHIWSPMTRWDPWPEKRHQPRDRSQLFRSGGCFVLSFPWLLAKQWTHAPPSRFTCTQ